MKLVRLLLPAFGPFTDTQIDFSGGDNRAESRLHLIYGPNEAGKSSALRAMTDLRFGIPMRSYDNFIHPSKDLRVAGVFVNSDGKHVGLVRRKGRKSTLSLFDPVTADTTGTEEAGAEFERALSGGLAREEFEDMFGLNHTRLREGGDRLLKGEGELGSALFEASAGTRGIAAILSTLDEDARALFSPRSKNAVINEARRALDDYRKAWKEAQTRPAEWQELNRAHQQAQELLAETERELESSRRRENELTELRTVAPLLRAHDLAVEELEGLEDAPVLAEDARETRLAAEEGLRRATDDNEEAEQELVRCADALTSLVIEKPLLEHGDEIERLANLVNTVSRSRIEAQQHQETIGQIEEELANSAARIAPGKKPHELLLSVPSAADRASLDEHLAAIPRLNERLQTHRSRFENLDEADRADADEAINLPNADARQALVSALQNAQELGNTAQQKDKLERDLRELTEQLTQTLSDLGIDSVEALRHARPLLLSQIDSTKKQLTDIDDSVRRLRDEAGRIDDDMAQQQRQQKQLAASGEIVTSDTLRAARTRRDQGWTLIRKAYVEASGSPEDLAQDYSAELPLPDAFEVAQESADRQADLLRADVDRAARYEECLTRISQMEGRQGEVVAELAKLAEQRQLMLEEWYRQLVAAELPHLEPEVLREWQDARDTALELAGRHSRLEGEHGQLLAKESDAFARITSALKAVGQAVSAADLPALIKQASRWERHATELSAKQGERAKAIKGRQLERQKLNNLVAESETELQVHLAAVDEWKTRLFLSGVSTPSAVKARLEELDGLMRRDATLRQEKLQQTQHSAVVQDFETQAIQLAALLGESEPTVPTDFAGRLYTRLKSSREQEQQRIALTRDKKRAEQTQHAAEAEIVKHAATLESLCAAAGVDVISALPDSEARSNRKRQLRAGLEEQHRQLTQATSRPEVELRGRLADQDGVALEAERERCKAEIVRLEQEQSQARGEEERARRALESIDASDTAAKAREAMESAVARYQGAIRPWARLRLAHALLRDSLKRFRERAQAPMVAAASTYFSLMTGERYTRLVADEENEKPVLLAERHDGVSIGLDAMSEGTADQLYLSLRLAALELRRDSHPQMPLILDDVLITSDDTRAANILKALALYAKGSQVLLFTHHRHLVELAQGCLSPQDFTVHEL